jgi:hypothetical protein
MADDAPDPQKLIKLARASLSSAERRRKFRRIDFLDTSFWYPTQLKFFAAGSSGVHQRMIYGGNQTGKTLAASSEVSWHLTGAYPDFWMGKRRSGFRHRSRSIGELHEEACDDARRHGHHRHDLREPRDQR